jgi:hypothetical protein
MEPTARITVSKMLVMVLAFVGARPVRQVLVQHLLVFCTLATAFPLYAGPLFENLEPLEIELSGPLTSLIKKKEKREEWPFRIRVNGKSQAVNIRARGKSRLRLCKFPPLRLNFKDTDTSGTVFEGEEKLKLVTHCRKGDRFSKNVLKEYVAYRIFNLLSDNSFRVRLVHITYIDSDRNIDKNKTDNYGFLIEPVDQLSRRIGGTRSGLPAISLKSLNHEQAALVYVYQYLIGNTDWSLVAAEGAENCCHNIELIEVESKQLLVPYDFDLAGIVNASYAKPDASLRLRSVRQRLYRGFCTDSENLRGALKNISSRQQDILEEISGLPLLTEKDKAKLTDYLLVYFTKAENEADIIKSFEKSCHP